MPTTQISDAIVFPEDKGTGLPSTSDADYSSAGHFGGLAAQSNSTDYVEAGMGFTPDFGTPALDIGAGLAYIRHEATVNVQDDVGDYINDWKQGISLAVQVPSVSGLALTDGATNHVFVALDLSSNNGAEYVINTTGDAPSAPSLKIGTVDTANDTVEELNRDPDLSFEVASGEELVLEDTASQ
ncbi:hypothetical protein SAMN06269185_3284 [Natronoarchaeum philippinense]|uniref:Uncharacterized protein n=1 Tax=Natronoarchaeum philippinense TaxID=558529 RepID=A0A285P8W6_NATPI|nr:hypothetical protein [Natronoarchaeum philippinense]SNZ18185.1 hypothetical protein SAMN06269185_3284 [Natronoarchaeum philippinense]